MTSTLNLIRSGLSSFGTRFGMGNEQSQQSQVDTESQYSQDEGVDSNKRENDLDATTKREAEPVTQKKTITFPPQTEEVTSKRRKRSRKRRRSDGRRLSNSASTVTGESVTSDIGSSNTPTLDLKTAAPSDGAVTDMKSPHSAERSKGEHGAQTTIASSQRSQTDNKIKVSPSTLQQLENDLVDSIPSDRMTRPSEARTVVNKGGRTWYSCPEAAACGCKEKFSMLSDAKRHAQTAHHGTGVLQCFVCSEVFLEGIAFRAHMAKHSAEELRSPIHNRNSVKPAELSAEQKKRSSPSLPVMQSHNEEESNARVSETSDEQPTSKSNSPAEDSEEEVQKPNAWNLPREVSSLASVQAVPESEPQHATEPDAVPAEDSLAKTSGTPDSGFDEPVEQEIIQETPRVVRTLKRGRDTEGNDQVFVNAVSPSKRPRRDIFSPPRSSSPEEPAEATPVSEPAPKRKLRALTSLSGRSGNLESFAKPIAPGSQLYHPIHNPQTPKTSNGQRVQVVIPRTTNAGPSNVSSSSKTQTAFPNAKTEKGKATNVPLSIPQKSVYTSPKGKRRAEPDVEYSTPTRQRQSQPVDNDNEEDTNTGPERASRDGIATSIARRTTSQRPSRKPATSRRKRQTEDNDEEPSSSGSDTDVPFSKDDDASNDVYLCQECRRRFKTLDALKKHEKKPDVHAKYHKCEECPAKFVSKEKLSKHQSQAGHGDGTGDVGRKGHFSQGETNKLHAWRDRFCDEYDLDLTEFNQIMTDTCRRIKGTEWPHRFITKGDFLQQYLDVLPARSRRSMLRYRERSFQNVPDNQKWTEEDDDELVNLVKEIGPKWVEIGQRMTRTQDSVNQRWRHKLKYRGKAVDGEWLPQDTELLVKVVNQVKRESNLSLDPNADVRIPWDLVSNKLKGKRTAQQCSNKWRLMHTHKKDGKRVRTSGVDRLPNTPSFMATPSKMSQRIAGSTPQTQSSKPSGSTIKKRKLLSEEIVAESNEEESDHGEEEAETDSTSNAETEDSRVAEQPPTSAQKRRKQIQSASAQTTDESISEGDGGSDPDQAESPVLPRNPLPARTPRNDLSISQMMNQTQANTSALRSATTARKQTQAERPSPNILIQPRPESSPLRMISTNVAKEDEAGESEADEDKTSDKPANLVDDEASEASVSDGVPESSASSGSATDRNDSDESSDEGSDEESDEGADGRATSQRSFLQSLRSPQSERRQKAGASETQTKPKKIDFAKAVRGSIQESPSEEESDSDDDEGDIMYRS